jgi:hypothetical protein
MAGKGAVKLSIGCPELMGSLRLSMRTIATCSKAQNPSGMDTESPAREPRTRLPAPAEVIRRGKSQ